MQVRVPTRNRERAKELILLPTVDVVKADVQDPATLDRLVAEADAVVNLIGILHGDFQRVHVELPRRIIEACRRHGVRRLVHVSALQADPAAPSMLPALQGRGRAAGPGGPERRLPDHDPAAFGHLRARGPFPQPVRAARAAAAAGRSGFPRRTLPAHSRRRRGAGDRRQPARSAHVRAALRSVRAARVHAAAAGGVRGACSRPAASRHRPGCLGFDAAGGRARASARQAHDPRQHPLDERGQRVPAATSPQCSDSHPRRWRRWRRCTLRAPHRVRATTGSASALADRKQRRVQLHPGHRQQELLVLVAAPVAADAPRRTGLPRGPHSPVYARIEAADPRALALGTGALPAGRRSGDLGLARHLRVPGRAPSRARAVACGARPPARWRAR